MIPEILVNNIKKYVSLTDEEVDLFLSFWKNRKVKRKQLLVETGEVARYQFFILSGCLRSFYTDSNGVEHNIQFAVDDWWISDMASFLSQKPALLTVEALEDSEVMQIDSAGIEELYDRIPKLERFFRLLLQNAFIAQQQRILSMISKTAEERYSEFISKYPQFEQRIPQVHVASYLGITPEFLSKLRKKIFSSK